MEIQGYKQDRHCIIQASGRMDAVTAPEFEAACSKWIDAGESSLVVDLGGLEYISSAGLRAVLVVAKKLKSLNGSICFCSLTPTVEKVFSVSGFTSMFTLYGSVQNVLDKA